MKTKLIKIVAIQVSSAASDNFAEVKRVNELSISVSHIDIGETFAKFFSVVTSRAKLRRV